METSNKPALKRDKLGRLLPGQQSLNSGGRPKKGSRPENTLEAKLDNAIHRASELTPGEIKALDDYQKSQAHDKNQAPAKSSRHATATTIRRRINGRINEVIDRLLTDAANGDTTAAKLVLERVSPQLKAFEHVGIDINRLPRMVVMPPASDNTDNVIDAVVVRPTEHTPGKPTVEMNEKNSE